MLSAFLIMLGGQLVAGSLSDTLAAAGTGVGILLFTIAGTAALSGTYDRMLIVARAIQGFGAAACMAVGRVIIMTV